MNYACPAEFAAKIMNFNPFLAEENKCSSVVNSPYKSISNQSLLFKTPNKSLSDFNEIDGKL